jgi:predicted DNA-binding protein
MSMKTARLQILIEEEQRQRLERVAAARGTSIATVVREAIDLAFPADSEQRRAAAEAVLAAEPMEVPGVDELLDELDAVRGRRA